MPLVSFHALYLWIRQSSDRAEIILQTRKMRFREFPASLIKDTAKGELESGSSGSKPLSSVGQASLLVFLSQGQKQTRVHDGLELQQTRQQSSYRVLLWLFFSLRWTWASLVIQTVKNLLAVQETRFQSLGQEDPLENGVMNLMATWPL